MTSTKADKLIDSRVPVQQCRKAVDALLSHSLKIHQKKKEKELLPANEDNIWLVVAVKKIHQEKKLKPRKM